MLAKLALTRQEVTVLAEDPTPPTSWMEAIAGGGLYADLLRTWSQADPERDAALAYVTWWRSAYPTAPHKHQLIEAWNSHLSRCRYMLRDSGGDFWEEVALEIEILELLPDPDVLDGDGAGQASAERDVQQALLQFERACHAILADLDRSYAVFLDDLTEAVDAHRRQYWNDFVSMRRHRIAEYNRNALKALANRATVGYVVYDGLLFIGDTNDDEVLEPLREVTQPTSSGTVRMRRARIGPGALEFSGVSRQDTGEVIRQVAMFSDKAVKFV